MAPRKFWRESEKFVSPVIFRVEPELEPTKMSEEDGSVPVEEPKIITLTVKVPEGNGSGHETVQLSTGVSDPISDIKQSLSMVDSCIHLTSYDLVLQGCKITEIFDDSVSLEEILPELGVSSEVEKLDLTVVQKAYTLSGVYDHILKFREVIALHFLDRSSGDLGVSSGAAKFNQVSLNDVKHEETTEQKTEQKTEAEADSEKPAEVVELSEDQKKALVNISSDLVQSSQASLQQYGSFDIVQSKLKVPIKSLSISQWSPVPAAQKTRGDLLYLTLQTLEGELLHITCHLSGFYVNRSSNTTFNPLIKVNEKGKVNKSFNLYDLVDSISPLFSKTIVDNANVFNTSTQFPETYLLPTNCLLAFPWLVNLAGAVAQPDSSRYQLPAVVNGVDGSEYVKDWNEDFQTIKELPKASLNERILREKLLNKSLSEFNKVATETAINIIKGNLTPLNPNEPTDRQIYLKNGIFYSFGINATGAFDATGGDEAARYTSSKDIAGVKVLNQIDADGIHNLVTCIVDYLGERVICQAPVPGILNSPAPEEGAEVEADKVSYGLSTDQSQVFSNELFSKALKPIADALHLKPHHVELKTSAKTSAPIVTSKDTKGIYGTENRKYVIDLYRTTPLDIEFVEQNYDESETSYPHGETVVRHEAVEEWFKRQALALFKAETERLEKEGTETKDGEKPVVAISYDHIVLNPDAFTGVNESKEDQEEVRSLSKFIKENLIEEFLNEVPKQVAPFDGEHLKEVLHRQGINLRYLGYIAEQCLVRKQKEVEKEQKLIEENLAEVEKRRKEAEEKKEQEEEKKEEKEEEKKEEKKEEKEEEKAETKLNLLATVAHYDAVYRIAVQEMIARAVKHLLRKLGKLVPFYLKPHFVAHFHNCLLGSEITSTPSVSVDDSLKLFFTDADFEFSKLTSADVFNLVAKEVYVRFRFTLPESWSQDLRPLQLLREIALKFGIQWKAQDYGFTKQSFDAIKDKLAVETQVIESSKASKKGKKKQNGKKQDHQITQVSTPRTTVFVADDILAFVPLVKDSTYKASLVKEIYESAKAQLYKGENDLGVTLLNELASIYEQIYGRVHPETAKFNSLLAQAYSDLGHKAEACQVARKSCILSERTAGFDAFESISSYINAAFFEAANDDPVNAFTLYQSAINLWTTVYGEDHPSSINTLSNLAEILTEHKLFDQAKNYYDEALKVSNKLNNEESAISAMIRYRYGILKVQNGHYKESIPLFTEALKSFSKLGGPDDRFTQETSNFITNINAYLAYNKQQDAEKKKALAQQAAANKLKVKSQPAPVTKNGKKGKKSAAQDPEIASKSIDDILLYIEGNNQKKSKKSANKKK